MAEDVWRTRWLATMRVRGLFSDAMTATPERPRKLPLLEAISWFDADPYALSPFEMLKRYESGWRHLGVLADPSAEELAYVTVLARTYGSHLRVPA